MVAKLSPGSFFGRTERRQTVAGLILLESVYPSELDIPPHEHVSAFFDFVVEGACAEVVRGQTRTRGRSTLGFHPAGEVHSSRWHGPESRCFHIEIPPAILDRVRQDSPILENPAHFDGGTPTWLARRLYNEFQRMDEVSPLAIEGLTLELMAECARQAAPIPERQPPLWLFTVCDLLHEKFSEPLTLGVIAESVGIHPAHVARVFRQVNGCTLGTTFASSGSNSRVVASRLRIRPWWKSPWPRASRTRAISRERSNVNWVCRRPPSGDRSARANRVQRNARIVPDRERCSAVNSHVTTGRAPETRRARRPPQRRGPVPGPRRRSSLPASHDFHPFPDMSQLSFARSSTWLVLHLLGRRPWPPQPWRL
jgi:AraC family transcriptional regulator